MPSLIGGGPSGGGPCRIAGFHGPRPMSDFYVPFNQPARYRITGVTRDSTGAALGSCAVEIFETASGMLRAVTTSDASGNYSLDVSSSETGLTFFAVAYKPGTPDVSGTTVNTLVGA